MSSVRKAFVVAIAMLGLSLLTAQNITANVQKLIFFPEPPLLFRIMFALHLEGLLKRGPARTDIVWDNGKFRYLTPKEKNAGAPTDIKPTRPPR